MTNQESRQNEEGRLVHVSVDSATPEGNLQIPTNAAGVVLFAHGSGSSRHSPRNRFVAQTLNEGGLATLLIDLLTSEEETIDQPTRQLRFDIDFLAERLIGATDWLKENADTQSLEIGYFGSSTGAAAALKAAPHRSEDIRAIVSRGGRPDLAGALIAALPTLIVYIILGRFFYSRPIGRFCKGLKETIFWTCTKISFSTCGRKGCSSSPAT